MVRRGGKRMFAFCASALLTFYLLKMIEQYSYREEIEALETETMDERLEAASDDPRVSTIKIKDTIDRNRDKYRTLMEILTSKSETESDLPNDDIDPSECINKSMGKFYQKNTRLIREVERRIREKDKGFAWVRWGDAEMIASIKDGQRQSSMQRAVRVLASKTKSPEIVLNVGGHWLCKNNLRQDWNKGLTLPMKVESSSPSSYSETRKRDLDLSIEDDCAIHSFFYLPLGDITDEDLNEWRKKKIEGWSGLIRKYNRSVILVGPNHIRNIPFIKHDVFIDATNVKTDNNKTKGLIRKVALEGTELSRKKNDPPVVILCSGLAAKTLVVVLRSFIDKGWQFIDVGTQLDGFGGKKSRDYINIPKMCKKVYEYKSNSSIPTENIGTKHDLGGEAALEYWFAPDVCTSHVAKLKNP
mmetsp:Transcript_4780/g.14269  ORF Transcript_4780/g.14269 Transcript_4780/m.14269 type:complete len:415 (-) Transcript_4780:79-1323(-)